MAPDITITVSDDIRVPPMFITDPSILDNFPELFYSSPERPTSHSNISYENTRKSIHRESVNKDAKLFLDSNHTEDVTKNESSEDSPTGNGRDLFDSTCVLPDNCQWWQQMEELSFEAPPGDFEVVDLPHFGYDLNYSSLWEDVDTFVSVIDVTDDVMEERAVYEPVYCLDTRRTTVWGLDIIWEEDEEYL